MINGKKPEKVENRPINSKILTSLTVILIAGVSIFGLNYVFDFKNVSAEAPLEDEDNVVDAFLPAGINENKIITAPEKIKNFGLFSQLSAEERPNIIIIITDDQDSSQLGLAGNNLIKTPNIDNLAKENGIYFNSMYVTTGQCAPSRAAIWTGKLPHANGVTKNGLILPPDQITLSEVLQANGYATAIIGKCHLGKPNNPEKYKRGFDFRLLPYPDSGMVQNWYSYSMSRNGKKESHKEYITDFFTDEAVKYIESQAQSSSTKPFFLWLSHVAPHTPTTPKKGSNVYSLEQMVFSPNNSDNLSTKPPQQKNSLPHKKYVSRGKSGALKDMKDAYEVVTNIDDNIGRVISAVKNAGIHDNTIIIFMTDNGVFFGQHEMLLKGPTFYEEQLKMPFIFHYPKMNFSSFKTNALISSIDIMPTILDILKISSPPDIQGKSFLPVLKGESGQARSSILMEYYNQQGSRVPMRGVVSADGWKWVHYMSGSKKDYELYDLKNDPLEMNNILKKLSSNDDSLGRMLQDAIYGPVIKKLRKERAVWQTDSRDDGYRVLLSGVSHSTSLDSVNVLWTTDKDATSEIEYRESSCLDCPFTELNNFSFLKNHSENINGLKPGTAYTIRIFSIDSYGDGGYQEITASTLTSPLSPNNPSLIATSILPLVLSNSPVSDAINLSTDTMDNTMITSSGSTISIISNSKTSENKTLIKMEFGENISHKGGLRAKLKSRRNSFIQNYGSFVAPR